MVTNFSSELPLSNHEPETQSAWNLSWRKRTIRRGPEVFKLIISGFANSYDEVPKTDIGAAESNCNPNPAMLPQQPATWQGNMLECYCGRATNLEWNSSPDASCLWHTLTSVVRIKSGVGHCPAATAFNKLLKHGDIRISEVGVRLRPNPKPRTMSPTTRRGSPRRSSQAHQMYALSLTCCHVVY